MIGDDVKEFPYYLMLMDLWPGDWEEKIDRMNKTVDEDNGRGETQETGQFRKLRQFSRNWF